MPERCDVCGKPYSVPGDSDYGDGGMSKDEHDEWCTPDV